MGNNPLIITTRGNLFKPKGFMAQKPVFFIKTSPILDLGDNEIGTIEFSEEGIPLEARFYGNTAWLVTGISEDGEIGRFMPTKGWLVYNSNDALYVIEVYEGTNTLIAMPTFYYISCFEGEKIKKKVCLELSKDCRVSINDVLMKPIQ